MSPDRGVTDSLGAAAAQSYPLQDLENSGSGSGSGSSEYVNVHRSGSSDSVSAHAPSSPAKVEEDDDNEHAGYDEPLLPTSEPRATTTTTTTTTTTPLAARGERAGWMHALQSWIRGPQSPRKYKINPVLPSLQTASIRLVDRYLPSRRAKIYALLIAHGIWALLFFSILHSSVAGPEVPGYGNPVRLSCVSRLWTNATNCGLNGDDCRPFDNSSFAFRCPAGCKATIVLEPYTVGVEEINYRSLVIGGSNTTGEDGDDVGIYRGDSYICAAAMHAGLVSDQSGGCGILTRTGEHSHYASVEKNGISSIEFPSDFPLSFTFERESVPKCRDVRWPLFAISVFFSCILSLFITSPAVFYSSIFLVVWFQVSLSSDPPYFPDYSEVVSLSLGCLLPSAFVGFAIYYFCVRHTLRDLTTQWEKTILWVGGCWVGALDNYTFDRLPISRLTPHDIQQQPGAIPTLIAIVCVLVAVVVTQAWAFKNEGRLPRYILLYGVMACGILALVAVPGMNLRIHHYILALLFLPGTALQTRPSLLYQGLLVGLFINGVARWGYDSILQTPAALLADAQLGSILPEIAVPAITGNNITFTFAGLAAETDGISVLVNDVERFHGFRGADGTVEPFTWTRHKEGDPEYFRFGYMKVNALGGTWYEDFTKPGIWEADGSWVQMEPGPSR